MASVKLVRDSGYADRIRAYQVVIDGRKVGEISNGQTKEFPVAPGHHQICLKIDWCGSKTLEFTLAEKDNITFHAKSNLRGLRLWAALWYVLFARDSYLLIERASPSNTRGE